MTKEKSCGGIIYKQENEVYQFLLIKTMSGNWGFPKGHVEDGETEVETAKREIKEETGLDVELDTKFREMASYYTKEDILKDVVYFIGTVIGGEQQPMENEIEDIKWLDKEEAKMMLAHDSAKTILDKATEYLKKEIWNLCEVGELVSRTAIELECLED